MPVKRWANVRLVLQASAVGILLCSATLAVWLLDRHANAQWQERYFNSALFKAEQVIFLDYRERQFKIYQRGSSKQLDQLRLQRQQNPRALALKILQDRSFYPYLREKGHLYFEPDSFRDWKLLREELHRDFQSSVWQRKLALAPEGFGPSQLITYPFAEHAMSRLVFECLVITVGLMFLIKRLAMGVALVILFGGVIVGGLVYGLAGSIHSPLFLGWSMGTASILGAIPLLLYRQWKSLNTVKLPRSLQVAALLWGGTMACWWLLAYLFWHTGLAMALAWLSSAGFGLLCALKGRVRQSDPNRDEHHKDSQWQYRVDLAKALDAIAGMRFEDARQKLKSMVRAYPEEIEVIRHLYHVEKLWPHEDTYWACAQELIHFAVRHNHYELALMLFNDIQRHAATKALAKERLTPEFYHKMMMIFVNHNDLAKAEQSFLFLELAGQGEIIKDACSLLKEEFQQRRNLEKTQQYAQLLQQM